MSITHLTLKLRTLKVKVTDNSSRSIYILCVKELLTMAVFARSFLDHKPKGPVTDKFLKPEKNYTSPNFFCQSMGGLEILIWLICRDVFYSDTNLCLWLKGSAYLPVFTFKERNSGLFCPIFLKFTFDNFTSPVGLAILKFYLPGPNFTSLGHRACGIFRRLLWSRYNEFKCQLHIWPWNFEPSRSRSHRKVLMERTHEGLSTSGVWKS